MATKTVYIAEDGTECDSTAEMKIHNRYCLLEEKWDAYYRTGLNYCNIHKDNLRQHLNANSPEDVVKWILKNYTLKEKK
jgi:hypothetical protein